MVPRSSWASSRGNSRKVRNLEREGGSGDGVTKRSTGNTLETSSRDQPRRFGGEEGREGKRHERMARETGFTVGGQARRRTKAEEGSDRREG
jgi:hypothetical protein